MSRLKEYYLGRMYNPKSTWATERFPALYETINGEWFGFPVSELEILTVAVESNLDTNTILSHFNFLG